MIWTDFGVSYVGGYSLPDVGQWVGAVEIGFRASYDDLWTLDKDRGIQATDNSRFVWDGMAGDAKKTRRNLKQS